MSSQFKVKQHTYPRNRWPLDEKTFSATFVVVPSHFAIEWNACNLGPPPVRLRSVHISFDLDMSRASWGSKSHMHDAWNADYRHSWPYSLTDKNLANFVTLIFEGRAVPGLCLGFVMYAYVYLRKSWGDWRIFLSHCFHHAIRFLLFTI